MNSKDLVLLYAKEWEALHKQRYQISWQKDCAIFARLRKNYSDEYLAALVSYQFSGGASDYVRRAGLPLGLFAHSINELIARYEDDKKKRAPVETTNFERLQAARKES